MKIAQGNLEAIVVAVLAVNSYSLKKAWGHLSDLRREGLTTPATVISEDLGKLTVRLANAGYNRGFLTEMMASRIQQLMEFVESGGLDDVDELVAQQEKDEVLALLCKVKGIGPTVAKTAWMLMSSQ